MNFKKGQELEFNTSKGIVKGTFHSYFDKKTKHAVIIMVTFQDYSIKDEPSNVGKLHCFGIGLLVTKKKKSKNEYAFAANGLEELRKTVEEQDKVISRLNKENDAFKRKEDTTGLQAKQINELSEKINECKSLLLNSETRILENEKIKSSKVFELEKSISKPKNVIANFSIDNLELKEHTKTQVIEIERLVIILEKAKYERVQ